MAEEKSRIRQRKEKLIEAGYKAVDELIQVLEAPIVKKRGEAEDLAAEKMKNAAAAKKMALDDSFSILTTIQEKENEILEEDGLLPEEKKTTPKKEIKFDGPESRKSN